MSETIWRATDLDGETYDHTKQPSPWNGIEFKCDADGQCFRYYGTEKPPPGECWEIVQTRKGEPSDQQATIERLTRERDEALRELANERARIGQVTTEQINVIAELRAKIAAKDSENGRLVQERRHWQKQIARQEMPEVVRELLTWFVENQVSAMPIQTKLDAVRDHYASQFRITGPGVYLSDSNSEYAVVHRFARGEYLCAHLKSSTPLHLLANEDGSFQGGGKLTKYLRPLE